MPWRVALSAERFLPSGVLGPVDFFELARLAARRRSETGRLGAGPGVAGAEAADSATGVGKTEPATPEGSETAAFEGSGSAGGLPASSPRATSLRPDSAGLAGTGSARACSLRADSV